MCSSPPFASRHWRTCSAPSQNLRGAKWLNRSAPRTQQLQGPVQKRNSAPSGVRHNQSAATGRAVAKGTKTARMSKDFSSDLIKR